MTYFINFSKLCSSLLIGPVQRIPRYLLLLKDLLSHTREKEQVNFYSKFFVIEFFLTLFFSFSCFGQYSKITSAVEVLHKILKFINKSSGSYQDALITSFLSRKYGLQADIEEKKLILEFHSVIRVSKKGSLRESALYLYSTVLVVINRHKLRLKKRFRKIKIKKTTTITMVESQKFQVVVYDPEEQKTIRLKIENKVNCQKLFDEVTKLIKALSS